MFVDKTFGSRSRQDRVRKVEASLFLSNCTVFFVTVCDIQYVLRFERVCISDKRFSWLNRLFRVYM